MPLCPRVLRNLPTGDLDLRNEDLAAQAFLDLRRGRALEEQFQCFAQVVRFLDRIALAGDVQFRAQGDEPIAFAVNDGR